MEMWSRKMERFRKFWIMGSAGRVRRKNTGKLEF